ncbi:hypothetical protein ACWC9T_40815 [Kitasatospora sp. NPDC001159]
MRELLKIAGDDTRASDLLPSAYRQILALFETPTTACTPRTSVRRSASASSPVTPKEPMPS